MNGSTNTSKLHVLVSGGGPVGLTLALLLRHLLPGRVSIHVYDRRWKKNLSRGTVEWKSDTESTERNRRREQVVTIQSRQYLTLPEPMRNIFLDDELTCTMWPIARGEPCHPRNIRISVLEDKLLELANNEKSHITLVPERFNAAENERLIKRNHVLAICEGASSPTRDHFSRQFGNSDKAMFSVDGIEQLEDRVLGLKVKSSLPPPAIVALTIAQNRFLLNSRDGEGYLNMRLTDEEAREVRGYKANPLVEVPCIQGDPCVMERDNSGSGFRCRAHDAVFFPAIDESSALMPRIRDGLKLFGVKEEDLAKITMWRLSMAQVGRFTAQLYPGEEVFGALLGDAANAIHFWPGRGLNSGLSSAISLARCLEMQMPDPHGEQTIRLREANFVRHEGNMAQLQFRHKTRAWKAMTRVGEDGKLHTISDTIRTSMVGQALDPKALSDRCANLRRIIQGERLDKDGDMGDLPNIAGQLTIMTEFESELTGHQGKGETEYVQKKLEDINKTLVIVEERVYKEAMWKRLNGVIEGLERQIDGKSRLPEPREEGRTIGEELRRRLNSVNVETLRTLYFSEGWNTGAVSGEEVDVDRLLPDAVAERRRREAEQETRQAIGDRHEGELRAQKETAYLRERKIDRRRKLFQLTALVEAVAIGTWAIGQGTGAW